MGLVAQRPVFDILVELAGTQKLIVDKCCELPLQERMCECVTIVSEEMCPFGRTMMKKCAHPSASTPSNGARNYCQMPFALKLSEEQNTFWWIN